MPARRTKRVRTSPARVGLRPLPVLGTIGSHAIRAGVAAGKGLHKSSLLDRLLRGRGWIGLLGVLLIGLVFLNVALLKLNAQAGRNVEAARKLRIANADLGGRVTRLSSAERIQRAGEELGFVSPAPGNIHYLTVRSSDGRLAARKIAQGEAAPTSSTPLFAADGIVDPTDGTTETAITPEETAPATNTTATGGPTAVTETPTGTPEGGAVAPEQTTGATPTG